jgi:Ca2+-dependent lipid-binding protein
MKMAIVLTLMVLVIFVSGLFGTSYKMTVKSAEIAERKSDGRWWDVPPSVTPETFVKVFVDGRLIYTTAVVKNTYSPSWGESFSFSYKKGQEIKIEVWDQDPMSDDFIGKWFGSSLPDERLQFDQVKSLYITIQ